MTRLLQDLDSTVSLLPETLGFDDPVPSLSGFLSTGSINSPHTVEQEVQRVLLSHPCLHFSSLVVHRTQDSICLQGVLELDHGAPSAADRMIKQLVRKISGIDKVLNHLVVKEGVAEPVAAGATDSWLG